MLTLSTTPGRGPPRGADRGADLGPDQPAGQRDAEADLAALGDLLTPARVPKVGHPAQIDWVAARAPRLLATLPAIESATGVPAAPASSAPLTSRATRRA